MLSCWLVVVTFEAVSMKLTSRFKYSLTGKSLVSDPTSSARTYTPTSTHINIKKLKENVYKVSTNKQNNDR